MSRPDTRLAVDIGGTFTDIVLETPSRQHTAKVLTTPASPEEGVLAGIDGVLAEAGVTPDAIGLFLHGTTLATNALIERKGAVTALVTTEGFRDILEMASEKRYAVYDLDMELPPPLVPRRLRFTVPERIAATGRVLLPLDEAAVRDVAGRIRESGATAVAVGLISAYGHPQHEMRVREILAPELPGVSICLSSEVCPEMREYERFSTTCANAYIRPLMASYLGRLDSAMRARGLVCPLLLMMSGGGLTTLDHARRFPIRLVELGPAGGAILAARIAAECGLDRVVAFDMGGTTAKICLIDEGEPERARRFEVARIYRDQKGSGLPLRIPVIELVEIGAGGGSIARVDALKRIAVGPDSAGAEPGPACYGRGGTAATVTDANVGLGRIDPGRFAGGKIALDAEAGTAALARWVGGALGLDGFWSAVGVSEIVEENMANAARVHAIERGRVISRYTLIAFGGGAPLHAGRLAQKLDVSRIVVPAGAGVGSAIGFLRAPVAFEVVRSFRTTMGALDLGETNRRLDAMRAEARAVVEPASGGEALRETAFVDARYLGQGHELTVPLHSLPLTPEGLALVRRDFEAQYRTLYGLILPDQEVELVTWAVTLSTIPPPVEPAGRPEPRAVEARETRDVYDPALGETRPHEVHWRPDLAPGDHVPGPAVIVEEQTATIVPAGFGAVVNGLHHLVVEADG